MYNRRKESGGREAGEIQMGWEILELFLSLIYFSYMRGQRMPLIDKVGICRNIKTQFPSLKFIGCRQNAAWYAVRALGMPDLYRSKLQRFMKMESGKKADELEA